jgi:hypothetical protein
MDANGKIASLYYCAQWSETPPVTSPLIATIPMYDSLKYDGSKWINSDMSLQLGIKKSS